MISSLTNRGRSPFMVDDGALNARIFRRFLKLLLQGATMKIFLILDNLKVHKTKLVPAWAEANKDRILFNNQILSHGR